MNIRPSIASEIEAWLSVKDEIEESETIPSLLSRDYKLVIANLQPINPINVTESWTVTAAVHYSCVTCQRMLLVAYGMALETPSTSGNLYAIAAPCGLQLTHRTEI